MVIDAGRWLSSYPYFFAVLPVLAVTLTLPILARNRDYALAAVFSGAACLPCSVLAVTYYGEYWRPVLLGGQRFGIEDMMFAYTAGTAAWMASAGWCGRRWTVGARSIRAVLARLLPWGLAAVADVGLWMAGVDRLTAGSLASAGLLLILLVRTPSLWRLAVAGPAAFTVYYLGVVKLQFVLWPNFVSYWNAQSPWGALVIGIPCGDVVWALTFGALWPVVVASALEIRFHRSEPEYKDELVPLAAGACGSNERREWVEEVRSR